MTDAPNEAKPIRRLPIALIVICSGIFAWAAFSPNTSPENLPYTMGRCLIPALIGWALYFYTVGKSRTWQRGVTLFAVVWLAPAAASYAVGQWRAQQYHAMAGEVGNTLDIVAQNPSALPSIPRSCPIPWCNCGGVITAISGWAGSVRRPGWAG